MSIASFRFQLYSISLFLGFHVTQVNSEIAYQSKNKAKKLRYCRKIDALSKSQGCVVRYHVLELLGKIYHLKLQSLVCSGHITCLRKQIFRKLVQHGVRFRRSYWCPSERHKQGGWKPFELLWLC